MLCSSLGLGNVDNPLTCFILGDQHPTSQTVSTTRGHLWFLGGF